MSNEQLVNRYSRYRSNPFVAWLKESFEGYPLYPSSSMKLARLYVDLAVDSKPQPDVLVVSHRWKQVLMQVGVVEVRFMNELWFTYRGVYIDFAKRLP